MPFFFFNVLLILLLITSKKMLRFNDLDIKINFKSSSSKCFANLFLLKL